jgi:hypothetical protein
MAESIRRSYREFVGAVADTLDDLSIKYGIAGSFASSQYGEPRQTLDVDLTLHLQPSDADRFAAAFDALQMAADAYAIRETYTYTAPLPFGVIDYTNGWKADCYFLRNTAYDRAAFARLLEWPFAEARQGAVWLYAPEDVILMKLVYYRMSQGVSTKHLRDITTMLANKSNWGQALDLDYLRQWAVQLQVMEYWQKLWKDAEATNQLE